MFKRFTELALIAAIGLFSIQTAQGQYGGVQVQLGSGYGNGLNAGYGGVGYGRGGYGYTSGYRTGYGGGYANSYGGGLGNGYGMRYGNGYGNRYGNAYGNAFGGGYRSYSQPGGIYMNGGNIGGYGYRRYSNVYVSPRYYSAPSYRYAPRMFR